MNVRKLQNGDAEKLEHFLSGYAETSMFLRSNAQRVGLEYQNKDYHGDYFGAFDAAGNVTGVLAHYWNGNIMMQAIDDATLSGLIAAFRKVVTHPVAGVLGADNQVEFVINELALSGEAYALDQKERLYTLDLDRLSPLENFEVPHVEMVEANEVDEDVLTRWLKAYEIEALGADDNEALDKHIENRTSAIINGTNCWVLMANGEPVSLSGFNARLSDIVQVGPVWTPPDHRTKGYARMLVALTLQKAKEQGVKKAVLFTNNPAAVKAYEAIGFKDIGFYRLALLKKAVNLI